MHIDISVDIAAATSRLRGIEDQVPFATARAATTLAAKVRDRETEALPSIFDRPTPFTMKSFGIMSASKSSLTAEVFAKRAQEKYLAPSQFGTPQFLGKGKKIRVPEAVRLNQYGNIPRGRIKSLLGKKGYFLGVIHGQNGLWKRDKRGHVTLMIAFDNPVPVKTRLDFYGRAQKVVSANVRKVFDDALADAVRTRK